MPRVSHAHVTARRRQILEAAWRCFERDGFVELAPDGTMAWTAFLTGGAAVGVWLDATRSPSDERRALSGMIAAGAALGAVGYAASFLPPIYADASFWTSSPTFFFLRLGVVVAVTGAAYALTRVWPMTLLQEFGRASLFVYWIHVEMVYGFFSRPIRRALSVEQGLVAYALFTVFLLGLVRLKNRLVAKLCLKPPSGIGGPSLLNARPPRGRA